METPLMIDGERRAVKNLPRYSAINYWRLSLSLRAFWWHIKYPSPSRGIWSLMPSMEFQLLCLFSRISGSTNITLLGWSALIKRVLNLFECACIQAQFCACVCVCACLSLCCVYDIPNKSFMKLSWLTLRKSQHCSPARNVAAPLHLWSRLARRLT